MHYYIIIRITETDKLYCFRYLFYRRYITSHCCSWRSIYCSRMQETW